MSAEANRTEASPRSAHAAATTSVDARTLATPPADSSAKSRNVRLAETSRKASAVRANYYDKSWGLVIGINDYQEEHPTLANARNDAAAFANLLRTSYEFDQVITLFDEEATCDTLMAWLRDQLPERVGKEDRLVIFFAGHGTTRESGQGEKRGYLIPHDAKAGKYAEYVDMSELRDACGWITAKHILLILDCCFSGVAAITSRSVPTTAQQTINDAYLREITQRGAWQVLTAGASDELAADSGARPGHSAFTSALLAGLEGQADQNSDGIITASELAGFVKPEVSRHSASGHARGQTPFFNYLSGSEQGDFVFLRHDTEIHIAPGPSQAPAFKQLAEKIPTTSPLLLGLLGLLGLLLIAVFFLGVSWWRIQDQLDKIPTSATATAAHIATVDRAILAAATSQPAAQRTALAASQTEEAATRAANVAVTEEAVRAGGAFANPPTATATVTVTPTPTATATRRPSTPTPTARPPVYDQRQPSVAFQHTARAGESWATVASTYGMTVDELKSYNRALLECTQYNTMCRGEPEAGDDLLIPALDGTTLIPRGTTYVVKRDDRAYRIAIRAGLSVADLQTANPEALRDPNMLITGTRLTIPSAPAGSSINNPAATQNDCKGLSNPPIQLDDRAEICLANGGTLGIRTSPAGDRLNQRLQDGTAFAVINGPICAYYTHGRATYPWWEIETDDGIRGWLVDGGDEEDPIYLCRLSASPAQMDAMESASLLSISDEAIGTVQRYWSLWGERGSCHDAWSMLSTRFKSVSDSAATLASFLPNCQDNIVRVTHVYDLDAADAASEIEVRGACALVRVDLDYSGYEDEITFGLIKDETSSQWLIHLVVAEHAEAIERANEVCY